MIFFEIPCTRFFSRNLWKTSTPFLCVFRNLQFLCSIASPITLVTVIIATELSVSPLSTLLLYLAGPICIDELKQYKQGNASEIIRTMSKFAGVLVYPS